QSTHQSRSVTYQNDGLFVHISRCGSSPVIGTNSDASSSSHIFERGNPHKPEFPKHEQVHEKP
ncbi:hypothetical protein Ancab_004563, partial [Ancistrocladus abbreviatus]